MTKPHGLYEELMRNAAKAIELLRPAFDGNDEEAKKIVGSIMKNLDEVNERSLEIIRLQKERGQKQEELLTCVTEFNNEVCRILSNLQHR